jgi:hypothetical protein
MLGLDNSTFTASLPGTGMGAPLYSPSRLIRLARSRSSTLLDTTALSANCVTRALLALWVRGAAYVRKPP